MMRTTIEMAREAAASDWALFREFMPEIHKLAELVRADERERLATKLGQDFKGAFGDDTCASWAVWIKDQK